MECYFVNVTQTLRLECCNSCTHVILFFLQELVAKYSQQMVKGMLQLLSNCPAETAHLRKELLIAAKHILTTDLRSRM